MKLDTTFGDAHVEAVCEDNNTFTLSPTEWPKCLPGKCFIKGMAIKIM
jgi:hypothetical protein